MKRLKSYQRLDKPLKSEVWSWIDEHYASGCVSMPLVDGIGGVATEDGEIVDSKWKLELLGEEGTSADETDLERHREIIKKWFDASYDHFRNRIIRAVDKRDNPDTHVDRDWTKEFYSPLIQLGNNSIIRTEYLLAHYGPLNAEGDYTEYTSTGHRYCIDIDHDYMMLPWYKGPNPLRLFSKQQLDKMAYDVFSSEGELIGTRYRVPSASPMMDKILWKIGQNPF